MERSRGGIGSDLKQTKKVAMNGDTTTLSRISKASDLSPSQQLIVMEEATEVPPFGFHFACLEQRLERRLGCKIAQSAIADCLSPYYNLTEWRERYVVTALGDEMEDFPGKGSGNHPPQSPLTEYNLDVAYVEGVGGGAGSSSGRAENETNHWSEGNGEDVNIDDMDDD
ncbi:unnamed protein product [Choristocarpus tenellus]